MEESTICSKCKATLGGNDKFCNDCGFPERGTTQEKGIYDHRIKLKKNIITGANKKLKSVKILIYVIAGLNFLMGLYYLTDDLTFADGIAGLIASILFLGCAVWVNKQPLTGILAAFVLWILLQLSVVLVDPALLFKGILLKIVFIAIFIKGISAAKDAKEYTSQLKTMKAS